jgi:hypothetical protein
MSKTKQNVTEKIRLLESGETVEIPYNEMDASSVTSIVYRLRNETGLKFQASRNKSTQSTTITRP